MLVVTNFCRNRKNCFIMKMHVCFLRKKMVLVATPAIDSFVAFACLSMVVGFFFELLGGGGGGRGGK